MLARQRKGELRRLNEQLRQINAALKRQAKIESYAPTLSYAPVVGRISEEDIIVDPRKEELISRLKSGKNFLRNQEHEKALLEFQTALELAKSVKDPIEEKKAARGLGTFLSVFPLFEPLSLMWQQGASSTCSIRSLVIISISKYRALVFLGASLQRQGKYRDAIKYHSMVLAISDREREESGNTEAYGAIADCYTELGDLEKAGKFYDEYIARLEKD